MDFKSIVVPAISSSTFKGALSAALEFGEQFKSHVIACQVRQPFEEYAQPVPYPMELNSFAMSRAIYEETIDELSGMLRKQFEETIEYAEISEEAYNEEVLSKQCAASWIVRNGEPINVLKRVGRMSDIVFMQLPSDRIGEREIDLRDRLVTEMGRPIFLVPAVGAKVDFKHVVIGWNGSIEATRAMTTALPILSKVEKVSLISVGDLGADMPSIEDAARYLRTHRINADVIKVSASEEKVTDAIQHKLDDLSADLFVMGGYSRSRLREWILGGVTRRMLRETKRPVLIVH